jgi:hypothetical protein
MIDEESPAGSWKQAIEWMRQVRNDATRETVGGNLTEREESGDQ